MNPRGNRAIIIGLIAGGVSLLCFILVIGLSLALVGGVFGVIKSSEVYQVALEQVQEAPRVREALGDPVEPGWWITGSVETSGASGTADIQFPINGSQDSGTVFVVATKSGGEWHYQTLDVQLSDGQIINLLE